MFSSASSNRVYNTGNVGPLRLVLDNTMKVACASPYLTVMTVMACANVATRLRGTYVPPKRAAPGPSSSPRRTLVSFFTRREEPASPTLTTNAAFDVSGARPESLGRTLPHGGSENGSVVSGGDSQTDAGMEAGGGNEVTVGQHLGVSVVRSKPLAKKKGESRSHPGYEV